MARIAAINNSEEKTIRNTIPGRCGLLAN